MKKYFTFKYIKGDFFGGLTAGIVALPLALAFGVSSGLGPSAGLYGAIFLSFFAALFGGTNTQISGPTAPMTAVSMLIIAELLGQYDGNIAYALPIILMVFFLAGLIQVLFGVFGIGKYIRYIPYPVVSGFMTAIGVIIIITQILPILGYYPAQDAAYVEQFKEKAHSSLIDLSLKEERVNGLFTLDGLQKTLKYSENMSAEEIDKEALTLAAGASSGVIGSLKVLPRALQHINWLEFALALGTIIIIYGFKRITKIIPSTLAALVIMSGIAIGFSLDYIPIEPVPGGLPLPHFEVFAHFSLSNIQPFIFSAITLALLGSIDSLLTSVVADNMTRTKHEPNKELLGQGIGNSIAALFGGLPGAGATIRTVVNINAGGKTRLSGMIAGAVLLLILLVLGPVASRIPAAVLAGILFTVGMGVMDYKGIKVVPSLPKDIKLGPIKLSSEVLIMILVLLLSTFWNLVNAVILGLIIASIMFMKKMGDLAARRSYVTPIADVAVESSWSDEVQFPAELASDVYIKHLDGPVFFGATSAIKETIDSVPLSAKYLVFRMDKVPYMDQSGVYMMEEVLMSLYDKNITPLLINIQRQPRYMMERIEIIDDLVPESQIFPDFEACFQWIINNVKHQS